MASHEPLEDLTRAIHLTQLQLEFDETVPRVLVRHPLHPSVRLTKRKPRREGKRGKEREREGKRGGVVQEGIRKGERRKGVSDCEESRMFHVRYFQTYLLLMLDNLVDVGDVI